MKINKKIELAAEFNPTKKSHQMNIFEMCKKIKDNKITLPLYQRDLSWTLKKAVDLFNYQLFGKAPVAPISINQISEKNLVPQISFLSRNLIPNENIDADHQSVVDGQQRLSTNFKAYINHEDFKNIVLDIAKAEFKIIESAPSKSQIPVGILLNEKDEKLSLYLQEKNSENFSMLFPVLVQVRSKIKNYNYTINIAENLNEDEQIKWFEVLNNAGSRVTVLQMAFSKLKIHGLDIYLDYTYPFKEKIYDFGLEKLFSPYTTNVSYPIAALNPGYEVLIKDGIHSNNYAPIPSDTKESILTKLSPKQLKQIFELTLDSLDRALNFIDANELIYIIDRIDYILYLTGYFAYNKNLDIKKERSLVEWVKDVDFVNMSNTMRREEFSKIISI
ncbi:GmrSD restriction endonuclease domain-containing protein [Clostridium perfringens]|uniref:GmrSD restriction endonuclease domain-containing protein n=1 Tax=Clostridium perfringens TaxID=1502 RepID=UPI000F52D1E7|nr:DUF262 domain-containing protein [Clostridium perfringens]EJT6341127.1 DUF262 domain-containing protein [Clostridium perfringens]ELQ0171982.1 DUF262 domain-containing protein [Clostridium perfringens]MCX0410578.1 DUF262 domain-containing protein [Clostridium perfringens]MDM1006088.1 DUF262 domain-containing protein [Clostridium perfringens]MDU7725419.1 DUF262 domain-containing protein [Clostridium perfringens]